MNLQSSAFDWSILYSPTSQRMLPIRNVADQEDATQKAALKLLSKPPERLTPQLIRTVIVNCHKDRVKAEKRRGNRERDRGIAEMHLPDPATRLSRREQRNAIKWAIRTAGLSCDQRCALWAWLHDRMPEFVERHQIPASTARVWVHRALQSLRPYMIKAGLGPG